MEEQRSAETLVRTRPGRVPGNHAAVGAGLLLAASVVHEDKEAVWLAAPLVAPSRW